MNWYALHVRSSQERLVAAQLDRARIEAFYPHLTLKSRDGYRDIEKKLFPGYVFGRFAFPDRRPVLEIPQVVSILGWDPRHPAAIPDQEIEAVRVMVNSPVSDISPYPFVSAGDRVEVTRGPLKGVEGYVVYSKGKTRLVVSVTMLARSISAEVEAMDVRLIERAVAQAA